jgi:putative transposase
VSFYKSCTCKNQNNTKGIESTLSMKKEKETILETQALNTPEELYDYTRDVVQRMVVALMKAEVDSLCGKFYQRGKSGQYYRSGSTEAMIYTGHEWHRQRCPRVRRRLANGKSSEYHLNTLMLAKDPEEWKESLMNAIMNGVSYRNVSNVTDRNISKGTLSKLWEEKASKLVMEMQNESLSDYDMLAIMMDGVWLSKELAVVVALGFDTEGNKKILGFNIGTSENEEVCKDLLRSLKERGLKAPRNRALLSVLDGGKALDKAVKEMFNGVLIQRCLIHKERNVKGYIPDKLDYELSQLFKRLRESRTESEAKTVIEQMKEKLYKYPKAIASIEESEEYLTTIFKIGIGSTLAMTFRSTNSIENSFRNVRRHIGRVTSWRERKSNLWVGSGLILAEKTFRRIRGYNEIAELIANLGRASPWGGLGGIEECSNSQVSDKRIDNNNTLTRMTA